MYLRDLIWIIPITALCYYGFVKYDNMEKQMKYTVVINKSEQTPTEVELLMKELTLILDQLAEADDSLIITCSVEHPLTEKED